RSGAGRSGCSRALPPRPEPADRLHRALADLVEVGNGHVELLRDVLGRNAVERALDHDALALVVDLRQRPRDEVRGLAALLVAAVLLPRELVELPVRVRRLRVAGAGVERGLAAGPLGRI